MQAYSYFCLMRASIEISYYPLKDEFIPHIFNFIEGLKSYEDINVISNSMSTQVFGNYDILMSAITKEIKKSMRLPNSVFVLKIINADLQVHPNKFTNE